MGDYMFMLENHLSADQFRVLGQIRGLAEEAGHNVFLTGGAMRDTLGGFPVRDLDFAVEGNALKLAKVAEKRFDAKIVSTDDLRKSAQLLFPGGVTAEIAMARQERFAKSGGKPQVSPGTIYDDLRGRDFTANAVALSLNKASLGLPIDPTNGVGDIERKELRTTHNYSFYDDPSRLVRLLRFKARLGFTIDERTKAHFENAREAGMLERISSESLGSELRAIAAEMNIADIIQALADEKLLELYSPALTGAKLNMPLLVKLQKARQMAPHGPEFHIQPLPLLLSALFDKLNPKERAALAKAADLTKAEMAGPQKLEIAAKKLERELKSAKLQKPSQLYLKLSQAPGEAALYVLLHSEQRLVQDRIKNYFQKYLPGALEVTDETVVMTLAEKAPPAGTPRFQKAKEQLILTRLDSRPKKPPPPPEIPTTPPLVSGFGRGPGPRPAPRHARL